MRLLIAFLVLTNSQGLLALGDQQANKGDIEAPKHTKPKEKTEKFIADIRDDTTTTRVQWLTFSGDQKIGGLAKEDKNDTSNNSLDLANIKLIRILKRFYEKNEQHLWTLVEVTFRSGVKDTYLFPQKTVICAEEIDTNCPAGPTACPKGDKAWYLNTIDFVKIIDDPSTPLTTSCDTSCTKDTTSKDEEIVPTKKEKKTLHEITDKPDKEAFDTSLTTTVSISNEEQLSRPKNIQEKSEFKEMELKLVEKDNLKEKTIIQATKDVIKSIIDFFKAIYNALRRAFW